MCCDGKNAMRGDRCCGDQNYTLADYAGSGKTSEEDVCCFGLHSQWAMGCKKGSDSECTVADSYNANPLGLYAATEYDGDQAPGETGGVGL